MVRLVWVMVLGPYKADLIKFSLKPQVPRRKVKVALKGKDTMERTISVVMLAVLELAAVSVDHSKACNISKENPKAASDTHMAQPMVASIPTSQCLAGDRPTFFSTACFRL